MHTALASDPRKSHATERRPQIAQEPAIHPGNTNIHLLRHTVTALQVRRPDRCCQAVLRIVRHAHRLLLRIEGSDMAHRSEDFFLHAARRFRQSSIDGWLHIKPLIESISKLRHSAAAYDGRS